MNGHNHEGGGVGPLVIGRDVTTTTLPSALTLEFYENDERFACGTMRSTDAAYS